MLELVNSGLHFFQDENNSIKPLLKVRSGSGGPKINGSDRIWILILVRYIFKNQVISPEEDVESVYVSRVQPDGMGHLGINVL